MIGRSIGDIRFTLSHQPPMLVTFFYISEEEVSRRIVDRSLIKLLFYLRALFVLDGFMYNKKLK
jgi:hypothetical protein